MAMWKIIMKNMDRQKILVYGINIALFSAILFVIISLSDLNDAINLGGDAENVKIVFAFCYFVIVMTELMFIPYSIRFYEKSRMEDYGLFLMLGLTKKKCCSYMIMEFALIFLAATIFGISLGMVIIKFIAAIFMVSGVNVSFGWGILFRNMLIVVCVSLALFGYSCLIGLFDISKADLSKTISLNRKKDQTYRIMCIFIIVGVILFWDSIKQLNHASFGRILLSLAECLTAFYFFTSFGLSFVFRVYRKFFRESFQRNVLKISDFMYRYKTNKTLWFLIFTLNIIVIFFSGGIMITTDQAGSGDSMLVLRISGCFMAVFTMICGMGILFLKQMNDIQYKQNNVSILIYLGMNERDRKKYAVCDFKILLVSSALLSDVIVWFYIVAESDRVGFLNAEYICRFAFFELFIIVVQYTYYQVAKIYLVRRMTNRKECW